MTAAVLPFGSTSQEDEAWDDFERVATRLLAEPKLLCDRTFMESHARAHERWRVLFLMRERRANVVAIDGGRG
jgi:hypothetical protein